MQQVKKRSVKYSRLTRREAKTKLYRLWWLAFFFICCQLLFIQAMSSLKQTQSSLEKTYLSLGEKKAKLAAEVEFLAKKLEVQNDPRATELLLKERLNVIPEGETKVLFHNEAP